MLIHFDHSWFLSSNVHSPVSQEHRAIFFDRHITFLLFLNTINKIAKISLGDGVLLQLVGRIIGD